MAYTSLLGLLLPATGSLSWGSNINSYMTQYLDSAIAGTLTLAADSDTTLTVATGTALSSTSSQYAVIRCTGARTAIRTITAPAQSKVYVISNATTGGYAVKLVGAGPTTGISIPFGTTAIVYWNGSDWAPVITNGPVVNSTATASSVTPDNNLYDMYAFTALASALTINAPSGTAVDGDRLTFRILDNGTPQTLTWNATYTQIGVPLPITTTANKTTYVGCMYNAYGSSGTGRWDVVSVTTQF